MVERIEQKEGSIYRIQEPTASKQQSQEDREREEEEEKSKQRRSFFEEKTDWRLFYEKTPHTTKSKTVMTQDIQAVRFQNLSIKSDPSIVEADILYKNKTEEGPVFIPIAREMAFKLQARQKGDLLPKEIFSSSHILQVLIPEPIVLPPIQGIPEEVSPSIRGMEEYLAPLMVRMKQVKLPSHWSFEIALLIVIAILLLFFFLILFL